MRKKISINKRKSAKLRADLLLRQPIRVISFRVILVIRVVRVIRVITSVSWLGRLSTAT
jgi:hypothetical protein